MSNHENARAVECGDCGNELDEATNKDPASRRPCPSCGSTRRIIRVNIEDRLELHSSLRYVHKGQRTGVRGRRLVEGSVGDSQSADGTWAFVEQLVDRIKRRYRKFVRTADGRVIRDVDEPLQEHRGFGSAKRSQSDPRRVSRVPR